ncbi:hypothetical protein [uncultured Nitrosomonas sp.]|uniref:hypothetical protein n=1 Tax=uncultured Nitrosomonas sp. TaxID=156424 RepID=UPI0025F2CFD1|nr:hypothetical protein [uncultured Nitrosomonas sp.]
MVAWRYRLTSIGEAQTVNVCGTKNFLETTTATRENRLTVKLEDKRQADRHLPRREVLGGAQVPVSWHVRVER